MFLEFLEDRGKLICVSPESFHSDEVVKYIKCSFTFTSKRWEQMDSSVFSASCVMLQGLNLMDTGFGQAEVSIRFIYLAGSSIYRVGVFNYKDLPVVISKTYSDVTVLCLSQQ